MIIGVCQIGRGGAGPQCPAVAVSLSIIFLLAPLAYAQRAAPIAPEDLTDEHIQLAIDAIAAEIADRMDARRFWEPAEPPHGESSQPGGYTALAALALLSAGESYQGPRLREAVRYLEDLDMGAVYGLAARAVLWAGLPARFQSNLENDARRLINGFQRDGRGWYYNVGGPAIWLSNSRRMFGALGLWEAANRGINVPRSIWQGLEDAFLEMQLADGGWNYRGDGPATGSMTASGLATLFITQDHLHAERFVPLTGSRREHPADAAIKRGLEWMDRHFTPDENIGITASPVRAQYFYYYLYSVERAALASGYKHFGGRDWFREGAAELIHRFCAWDENARTMTMHERTYGDGRRAVLHTDDLAFGLMFLSRGRVPVAVNKLRDDSIPWNNRPRDVANLTHWLSDEIASQVNWQVVDIDAEPESWLDAPMLFFASNRAVPWARAGAPELDKIKRYLDLGGMMLAVHEGAGRAFAESIENAGRLMYPHYEWRTLEADHWAYSAHYSVTGNRPRLRGLSNGVRELIIVSSDDLSATLQARKTDTTAHYHTFANLFFYASEMNRPKPRLSAQTPATLLDDVEAAPHVSATIVRAKYEGNWNPEPLALEVLRDALAQASDLSLTIVDHPLDAIHELTPRPEAVIVSGVEAHLFTEAQQNAIKHFIESGGVILFETAGGRMGGEVGFVQSAEAMAQRLTGQPIRPLRAHPIMTGENDAAATDLSRIEYRPYSMHITGVIETTPRLRGIAPPQGGIMLFTRDDLSHALLDQPAWGIAGYSPRSARLLLRNVLLQAR